MKQAMAVLTSQGSQEWFTPAWVLDRARRVLQGISLDPASCEEANIDVKALKYYNKEMDGLSLPWDGTVFLNPPFDDTPRWVRKLDDEYESGRTHRAILLVNSALGYKWYEAMWRKRTVCCLEERLRFVSNGVVGGGQAKKGQTLAFYGRDDARFAEMFGQYGRIIRP